MLFTTDRLFVRMLKEADLPYFYKLQSSADVMQYVGGVVMTADEIKKDLKKIITRYTQPDNDFWVWAIVRKEDQRFIGTCAMVKNEKEEHEIGFRFLTEFWGSGYGKEVVGGLIAYAFTVLKQEQLVAYVNTENKASVKILEQYFRFEKEMYNEKEQCTDRFYVLYNDTSL